MKRLAAAVAVLLAAPAFAALKTQVVEYKDGDVVLQGYAAWDDAAKGSRPGVLVVHEWWGHGPYARKRAEMLAKLGYTAFALDMYGKGKYAKDHEEAGKLAGAFFSDRAAMRHRAMLGLDELKKLPHVDASKLAAIGYCFGGASALQLARTGADLTAVVSFHGGLQAGPEGEAAQIKAALLILSGASDPVVPDEAITALKNELRAVPSLDWQLTSYSGAMHAFTLPDANSPEHGAAYNATAERRSWTAMRDFLAEMLG